MSAIDHRVDLYLCMIGGGTMADEKANQDELVRRAIIQAGLNYAVLSEQESIEFPSFDELREAFAEYHSGSQTTIGFTVSKRALVLRVDDPSNGELPFSCDWKESETVHVVHPVSLRPGFDGDFTFIGERGWSQGSGCESVVSGTKRYTVTMERGVLAYTIEEKR